MDRNKNSSVNQNSKDYLSVQKTAQWVEQSTCKVFTVNKPLARFCERPTSKIDILNLTFLWTSTTSIFQNNVNREAV